MKKFCDQFLSFRCAVGANSDRRCGQTLSAVAQNTELKTSNRTRCKAKHVIRSAEVQVRIGKAADDGECTAGAGRLFALKVKAQL